MNSDARFMFTENPLFRATDFLQTPYILMMTNSLTRAMSIFSISSVFVLVLVVAPRFSMMPPRCSARLYSVW